MALKFIEDEYMVTNEEWVKVANIGQNYVLQVESLGENNLKVKSFSTEQTIANIPKTGGALMGYREGITQNDFDGYIYILASRDTVRYNLHRDE